MLYWYLIVILMIATTLALGYINIFLGILAFLFFFINWPRINSYSVNLVLIDYAKKIAKDVDKIHKETKIKYPDLEGKDLTYKMAELYCGGDMSKYSEKAQKSIKEKCLSINCFGYMLAMDFGTIGKFMVFRLLQFTRYLDNELTRRGYKKQPKETKEKALKVMGIYSEDYKKWTGE